MKLTQSQESAVARILDGVRRGDSLLSLSGAAGTGKSTLISAIVDALGNTEVEVCTPTLKAAQVLRAKGIEASTFYKIFYVLEKHKDRGKPRFVSCQAFAEMNKGGLDWDAHGYKAQAVLRLDSGALAEAAVNMETFAASIHDVLHHSI
jgi:hypothetical protein